MPIINLDMELKDINLLIKGTLLEQLGIEIISVGPTIVEASMPVDNRTVQPFQVLHGGAGAALAESVAAIGSLNLCAPGEACYGIQLSANHISTAKAGDRVHAKANIIQKGVSIHVWNVDIFSVSTGKLVSTIRVTNSIVKKK